MGLNRDWWGDGVEPLLDKPSSVTTSNLTALSVTSEKLSANALRRTVVCMLPDLSSGSTNPLTSAHGVFKPSVPVTLAGFSLAMVTSWVMTTVQTSGVGTLYNGAGAALGTVNIPSTAPPARGTRIAGVLSTSLAIAAAQEVTFGMTGATSAGWDQPAMLLQLDLDTTG